MNFNFKIDAVLLTIIVLLCVILVYSIICKLSLVLPYRVNCWFCNHNFWIKLPNRNSWTCANCDQYNGFTKDGDYNKPLIAPSVEPGIRRSPNTSHKSSWSPVSPVRNGLCKMCNINQQLKVAQLANFVPMNEKRYDEEVEAYSVQLEKAYRLCSPCRKVVQIKLHREKETLLGTKLLQSRTQEKRISTKKHKFKRLKNFTNTILVCIGRILLLLFLVETAKTLLTINATRSTIIYCKEISVTLFERIFSIIKMKALTTFPEMENYSIYLYDMFNEININKIFGGNEFIVSNDLTQKMLAGIGCGLQIPGHLLEMYSFNYAMVLDILWTVVVLSVAQFALPLHNLLLCLIKVACIIVILHLYRKLRQQKSVDKVNVKCPPKRMKNLAHSSGSSLNSSMDTEEDVSLSKLGVNCTDLSREVFNSSFNSGRASPDLWNKSRLNSSFCSNSLLSRSSTSVFAKPAAKNYPKDDSDSDLDDCISCLNIGPRKPSSNTNSVFSLRSFTPMPFIAPNAARPVILPGKLGSTSWVAGGYWGAEGNTQLFNVDGSRSSSQSSGFESQTSSGTLRNIFSQPPSREESICGDETLLSKSFSNCNVNASNSSNRLFQTPQNFNASLVYPQMNSDNYVHIPQSRYSNVPNQSAFSHNSFIQNNSMDVDGGWMFKTPRQTPRLAPQMNSFASN